MRVSRVQHYGGRGGGAVGARREPRSDGARMKILAGGCRVYAPEDGQVSKNGSWTARTVICRSSGSKQVTQSVNDYEIGRSPAVVNPNAEEVLYVASGLGVCWIDGSAYDLRPGVAVYVPPGSSCSVENAGAEVLRIV